MASEQFWSNLFKNKELDVPKSIEEVDDEEEELGRGMRARKEVQHYGQVSFSNSHDVMRYEKHQYHFHCNFVEPKIKIQSPTCHSGTTSYNEFRDQSGEEGNDSSNLVHICFVCR